MGGLDPLFKCSLDSTSNSVHTRCTLWKLTPFYLSYPLSLQLEEVELNLFRKSEAILDKVECVALQCHRTNNLKKNSKARIQNANRVVQYIMHLVITLFSISCKKFRKFFTCSYPVIYTKCNFSWHDLAVFFINIMSCSGSCANMRYHYI